MFPVTDNPAKRLLAILTEAINVSGKSQQVGHMWAEMFGYSADDTAAIYRIIGPLVDLIDSVELRVKQIEGLNHDLYLRDLPTIRRIVCPDNLQGDWRTIRKPLDSGALTGLEFCANELGNRHEEDDVAQDDINRIRGMFSEVFSEVTSSDLNADLKLILYDLLTSAINSLDYYNIHGNDGLKRTVTYTIGVLNLHNERFRSAKESNIVKRAFSAVSSLCSVLVLACKMKELGGHVQELLETTSS